MGLAGGFNPVSSTDIKVMDMARRAVDHMAAQDGAAVKFKMVRVASAEIQIVAGANYQLKIDITKDDRPAKMSATVYLDLRGNTQVKEARLL